MGLFLHLLSQYGYVALFFFTCIGGTYVPVPSGIILVAAGALSHHHYFNLPLTFIVALAGSLTDDAISYAITRRVGRHEKYLNFVRENRYASYIERQFKLRPSLVVMSSRFIGFAGMPVNALAGLTRMPAMKFFGMAALGDSICILIYLAAGYLLGLAWAHDIHMAVTVLSALIAIGTAAYLGFFFISRARKSTLNRESSL